MAEYDTLRFIRREVELFVERATGRDAGCSDNRIRVNILMFWVAIHGVEGLTRENLSATLEP